MKSQTAILALLVLIVIAVSGCETMDQKTGNDDVARRDAPPPAQQAAAQDPKQQTDHLAR